MECFPQERIAETKDFLRGLWNLEDLPRPAFQINLSFPLIQQFGDWEAMLEDQLAAIEAKAATSVQDDYVPALFPYLGVTIFPSAFGCQVRRFEDDQPWAEPLIGSEASRVYDLPRPNVTDGHLADVLECTRYFVERTNSAYPIRMTDVQGPLDVAYLIWGGQEFMMAMHTNPEEVHYVMGLVTELIITFVNEQRRLASKFVPCHWPPIWMPEGMGISISDDVISVIGPELYQEFALPYVNELSEAFNGIFIHTCGDFRHNFVNLKKVRNLRGLNFGASETPFEDVQECFGGRTVLVPHLGLNKDIHFESTVDFVEHILRVKMANKGLFLLINTWYTLPEDGEEWGEEDFATIEALIQRYR